MSGIGALGLHAATRLTLVLAIATGTLTAVAAPVTTNAPIIVTASRAGRTLEELPAHVTVITADQLRDSGVQNVVSALETLGGVYFRRSSDNPGRADISLRGFGDNSHGRVLVLVDGQRLNSVDMAPIDWLRIPVGTVERIEVLRGGETALYGNYAVAGVINIITHQPSGEPSTTVSATAGSDNTFAGHVGHSGSVGETRYTADADWRRSDGWRDNSQYENTDVRASLARTWTANFSTDLAAFYTWNTYGLPGTISRGQLAQDPRHSNTPRDQGETRTFGGSLGCNGQIDADSRIEAGLAATRRSVSSEMYSFPFFSDSILDSATFTPRYTRTDDLAGHRNRLLVGVDLGMEMLGLTAFDNPARTLQNTDATLRRANAGAYLQDEFEFSRQLALTLGGRHEIYRYSAEVSDFFHGSSANQHTTYHQTAGDAALIYRPTDQVKVFARLASLYRDPFLDELTSTYGTSPYSSVGMSLGLRPETGLQAEIGASAHLGQEWTAEASAYRLDMHDEIAVDPKTWLNSNLDDTRRYGADTSLTWARKEAGLVAATYNYVDARFSRGANEGHRIPLVPAHVLTLRGELELPFDLAALAAAHIVGDQVLGNDNPNRDVKLPSYGTLDLGVRYHPRQVPGLDVLVGVDNVFDAIYANSGYSQLGWGGAPAYYPAAGRMWKVGVSYRF